MFYLFLFDLKIRKICNSYSQLPNESSAEVGLVLKKLKTDLQKIQNRYCINLLWFFGRLDFAIYLGLFDWFHGNQFFKNPWKSDVKKLNFQLQKSHSINSSENHWTLNKIFRINSINSSKTKNSSSFKNSFDISFDIQSMTLKLSIRLIFEIQIRKNS